MKKIAFVCYRNWAFDIFTQLESEQNGVEMVLLVTTPEHEFELPKSNRYRVVVLDGRDQANLEEELRKDNIDTICFYGWSWIVKEPILSQYTCLCLHPSALPTYRGGSPIQHQLIAGETESAVSIIKMSEGIDDGDIYLQVPISLNGYLPEILERIVAAGVTGTKKYFYDLVQGHVQFSPQQGLEAYPPLKRRVPKDGEVFLNQAHNHTYEDIYNLVRGLQAPYPNAYITTPAGIIHLEKIVYSSESPSVPVLNEKISTGILSIPCALRVADGYVVITEGRIEAVI